MTDQLQRLYRDQMTVSTAARIAASPIVRAEVGMEPWDILQAMAMAVRVRNRNDGARFDALCRLDLSPLLVRGLCPEERAIFPALEGAPIDEIQIKATLWRVCENEPRMTLIYLIEEVV